MKRTFDDVLLVPGYSTLKSRSEPNIKTQIVLNKELAVPIVGSPMSNVTDGLMANTLAKLGAIGIVHRFNTIEAQMAEMSKISAGLRAAAVGVAESHQRAEHLYYNSGVTIFAVDVSHGDNLFVLRRIESLKKLFPNAFIIGGSVVTKAAVRRQLSAGAAAIRVGIGPGSICTTRIVTGFGYPQFDAIMECAQAAGRVPVIADGGIKNTGDILKALAAGASSVMLGNMLAGFKESPAEIVFRDHKMYKVYFGMASQRANEDIDKFTPLSEGVEGSLIPFKGKLEDGFPEIVQSIKTGFSYCGADCWANFHPEIIDITSAAMIESHPHGVMLE